jgi:drug/metabolite transporter (DMT)-like permease
MTRAHQLVLLAAVLFGTTGTAQALGPDGTSPLTVGASRIAIGGAALVAIAHIWGRRSLIHRDGVNDRPPSPFIQMTRASSFRGPY